MSLNSPSDLFTRFCRSWIWERKELNSSSIKFCTRPENAAQGHKHQRVGVCIQRQSNEPPSNKAANPQAPKRAVSSEVSKEKTGPCPMWPYGKVMGTHLVQNIKPRLGPPSFALVVDEPLLVLARLDSSVFQTHKKGSNESSECLKD